MALDRNNRTMPYVSGRMIAIAEHYAGDKFGPGTLSTMFTHPNLGVHTWLRYIDKNDEYYQELADIQLPDTTPNEIEKSQVWVGYYHQKAAYGDTQRGGARPNSGRKATPYKFPLNVRITKEANDLIAGIEKKSEYIDELIKKANK